MSAGQGAATPERAATAERLEDRLTPGWWSGRSKGGRVGAGALLGLVTVLLTVVIVTRSRCPPKTSSTGQPRLVA